MVACRRWSKLRHPVSYDDMERKRVFEIKKRFEDLDRSQPLRNGSSAPVRDAPRPKPELPPKRVVLKKISDSSLSSSEGACGKNVIKRTPAFRSSKSEFNGGKVKLGISSSAEDGRPPLPKGPPPIKPPRTFAHRAEPAVRPPISAPRPISASLEETKPIFKRSKTEPLIMLKKIEKALTGHQRAAAQPLNGNHYDVPYDTRRGASPPEPLYSEPVLVRAPPPHHRLSTSLHYMSSPIVDSNGNPRLERNPTREDTLKKVGMWAPEPNGPQAEPDSDVESLKEVKQEVIEERKIYAQRLVSMRLSESVVRGEARNHRLMEALLLIGIDSVANNEKVPYIKSKYPRNEKVPPHVEYFIFPDATDWPPSIHPPLHLVSTQHNNYTVVLTSDMGVRTYAYCRRLQPEGSSVCLPLVYAILTTHKAVSFYYQILEEIESNHGLSEQKFNEFVRGLYNTDFPQDSHAVRVGDSTLSRRMNTRHDGHEISQLLKAVGVPRFLQLLSNILLEKKIVLISSSISLLSDSIEGLLKAIYPFVWHHTLVTVVPFHMFEILQSPIPYIVGILKSSKTPVTISLFQNIDHLFVVDVDRGQIVVNTDPPLVPVIPGKLAKALHVALYETPVNGTDVGPSEALLRLFVQLVGHYRNHFVSQCDSYPHHSRKFQRENFAKAPSSNSVKLFLEWFTETPMFQMFIQEKCDHRNSNESLLFDQRCAEFLQENAQKKNTKAVLFKRWK